MPLNTSWRNAGANFTVPQSLTGLKTAVQEQREERGKRRSEGRGGEGGSDQCPSVWTSLSLSLDTLWTGLTVSDPPCSLQWRLTSALFRRHAELNVSQADLQWQHSPDSIHLNVNRPFNINANPLLTPHCLALAVSIKTEEKEEEDKKCYNDIPQHGRWHLLCILLCLKTLKQGEKKQQPRNRNCFFFFKKKKRWIL